MRNRKRQVLQVVKTRATDNDFTGTGLRLNWDGKFQSSNRPLKAGPLVPAGHMMRKIFIGIAALAAVALISVAAVYLFVDVNSFRPTIQAELQKQLRRPVTAGRHEFGAVPAGRSRG